MKKLDHSKQTLEEALGTTKKEVADQFNQIVESLQERSGNIKNSHVLEEIINVECGDEIKVMLIFQMGCVVASQNPLHALAFLQSLRDLHGD